MDRVQLLKQESAGLGGDAADEAPWPSPIEAQEDAIEVAGVYLQDGSNRDESTLISRSGSSMVFKDVDNPSGYSLTQLASSGGEFAVNNVVWDNSGGIVYDNLDQAVTKV